MRFNPVEFRSYFFCGLLISTHDKTVSLALQVSMFDLTIQLETESETIYRDVCLKIKEASSTPPLQSVLRYCMKMSEENSASSVFVSEPHSSIVDGKSGCQVIMIYLMAKTSNNSHCKEIKCKFLAKHFF